MRKLVSFFLLAFFWPLFAQLCLVPCLRRTPILPVALRA